MGEHTPGPWNDVTTTLGHPDNQRNRMIGSATTGQNIARLFSEESTLPGLTSLAPTAAEARANAQLIAAAPDLLEACQAVLNGIEGFRPDIDVCILQGAAHRKVKAAIAKAEGHDYDADDVDPPPSAS